MKRLRGIRERENGRRERPRRNEKGNRLKGKKRETELYNKGEINNTGKTTRKERETNRKEKKIKEVKEGGK